VVLNVAEAMRLKPKFFTKELELFVKLASEGGGKLQSGLGECELKVVRDGDSTALCLRRELRGVALAVLALEDHGQDAWWEELLQTHLITAAAYGHPVKDLTQLKPNRLPWIGISLAPRFLEAATLEEVVSALTTIWQAAYGCLEHGRRLTARN
jgi:hypothetical protein